jgi:membrane protein
MALVIAIAGLVGGREIVHDEVVGQVGRLLGEEGQLFIEDMLVSLSQPSRGLFAGAISVIVLIFGALGVFAELQNSLNTIWEVKPKPVKGVASSVGRLVRQRILSFSMVLAIGFVLLASLVLNAVLSALSSFVWASSDLPEWVTQVINGITTFLVITILFALIFKSSRTRTSPGGTSGWARSSRLCSLISA